jgi:hypothetical protein
MFQQTLNSICTSFDVISPSILGAGLVLLGGVLAAKSIEALVVASLEKLRLNQILKRLGLEKILSRIDVEFDIVKLFGTFIKWFIIIIFLMACSEILGLSQFSQFLEKVIAYFPNILVAFLIFIAATFLADFSQKIVVGTLEKERITYSRFLGRSIRWIIWFFAILSILYQLKITPPLILAVFIGMVATISLALGIAFGLGGKELAARILKELEEKLK